MSDRDQRPEPPAAAGAFEEHRRVLFTLAYELTGSAADADDIVQETWLRRARVTEPVTHERALLCRIATRLALNLMRDTARRREDYVGPWLPEPIATTPDVLDDVVLAESVSQATLTLMETLSPDERAVFVLVEVFAFSADDAGETLSRSPESVRQLVHRARRRLRDGTPHRRATATPELWMGLAAAIRAGDVAATTRLLTDDCVLVSDGGGIVSAALRPVRGADKVARFLNGIASGHPEATATLALVNGEVALIAMTGDRIEFAGFIEHDGHRIRNLRLVRNPDKLTRVSTPVTLER